MFSSCKWPNWRLEKLEFVRKDGCVDLPAATAQVSHHLRLRPTLSKFPDFHPNLSGVLQNLTIKQVLASRLQEIQFFYYGAEPPSTGRSGSWLYMGQNLPNHSNWRCVPAAGFSQMPCGFPELAKANALVLSWRSSYLHGTVRRNLKLLSIWQKQII